MGNNSEPDAGAFSMLGWLPAKSARAITNAFCRFSIPACHRPPRRPRRLKLPWRVYPPRDPQYRQPRLGSRCPRTSRETRPPPRMAWFPNPRVLRPGRKHPSDLARTTASPMPAEFPAQGNPSRRHSGLPLRLWRGDVSLFSTYMLLVAGYVVSGLVERKLIADETEVDIVEIVVWVFLAWTIFITIAFPQCKEVQTRQSPKWLRARLAQVFACLVIVLLLVDFGGVWRKNATLAELDAAVAEASRRGPRTLEDGVRYDGLSRHGKVFVYNMTVTEPKWSAVGRTGRASSERHRCQAVQRRGLGAGTRELGQDHLSVR